MLDPRIYRAALAAVLLAIIVCAFSLGDQPAPVRTTLAPDAFTGQRATEELEALASRHPQRRPGDVQDEALAREIAATFRSISDGFAVSSSHALGETIDGERRLTTVIARQAGAPGGGLVVVAHRDAAGRGARAELSGTAAMLELARVVSGQLRRSITFASTSGGSGGAAGASELAGRLAGRTDAVLMLGDLAGARVDRPVVTGWSNEARIAPLQLRRTVEAAVRAEAGTDPGKTRASTQWARLAFPFTVGEQGPLADAGLPAVLLSVSGERGPGADDEVTAGRLQAFGRAALRTIQALDAAPSLDRAPERGIVTADKVLPAWAVRLLVGALLLAPILTVVDAFARARRRHQPVVPWLRWLGATAVPFLAAALFAALLGQADLVPATPQQPVPPDALPFDGPARIALASVALVFVLAWIIVRGPLLRVGGAVRDRGANGHEPGDGGMVVALLLSLVALATATWLVNPWAAALFVPAAHLWLLFGAPDLRLRRAAGLAVVGAGALPFGLLLLLVAGQLGMSATGALWFCLLLVAGGHASPALWLLWSLVAACFALATMVAWRARPREPEVPIARSPLRGPLSYAGPGSLGGTESALRR
jgi:hypothetical protein